MGNFLLKRKWSNQDWDVFDSNINILLNEYRLKKGEFNDIIGVKNFFRKDRQRVSLRVIDKICKEFNIERDWLEISHKFQDRKIFTKAGATSGVADATRKVAFATPGGRGNYTRAPGYTKYSQESG